MVYVDDLYFVLDCEMVVVDMWVMVIMFSGGIEMFGELDVVFVGFKIVDGEMGYIGL